MRRSTQKDIDKRRYYCSSLNTSLRLTNGKAEIDDIDHLSNRRVRTVGEQLYAQFGVGLARMARTIRERMNVRDNEVFTPVDLINARTLSSVINSFFGTSQLSQFLDQTNPLSEITHKRRISALGPGGLSRERAGFEVRDVHYSHYGRLCTIETPEGPNIGLISTLCVHAKINDMGFIETPYRKVEWMVKWIWRNLLSWVQKKKILPRSHRPTLRWMTKESSLKRRSLAARQATSRYLKRLKWNLWTLHPTRSLVWVLHWSRFLEHDDANRALMGSNMQRQAVPLIRPDVPDCGYRPGRKSCPRCEDPDPLRRKWYCWICGCKWNPCSLRQRWRGKTGELWRWPQNLQTNQVHQNQPGNLYQPETRS